jgi:hypothetical protein
MAARRFSINPEQVKISRPYNQERKFHENTRSGYLSSAIEHELQ